MRRVMLIPLLIAPMLITQALVPDAPTAPKAPIEPTAEHGTCVSAATANANASSPTYRVEDNRRTVQIIPYALLDSILTRDAADGTDFLDRQTFVGSGELMVYFSHLTPDGSEELKIVDYYNQRSSEALDIDKYGRLSVPLTVAKEHGLPEFSDDDARATLICSEKPVQARSH